MNTRNDPILMCIVPDGVLEAANIVRRYLREQNAEDLTSSICGLGCVYPRDQEIARLKEKLRLVAMAIQ